MSDVSLALALALAAYLAASALYVSNLLVGHHRPAVAGTVAAGAGALAHAAGLVLISAATQRGPYSTFFGAAAFTAWLVVLMQIGLVWRARLYALGALSLPIASLLLLGALVLPPETRELSPILQRQTLAAHISVTLLGYGAFAVAFGLAVIYLQQNRLLKAKRLRGLFERLPPLRTTEELAARFAAFGHAMLTLGIGIGIVYALREPGARLHGDPKVPLSLATWGIYTTYLGLRWGLGWRGRTSFYLLVAGFAAVLITFVGANLLFPGVHGSPRP